MSAPSGGAAQLPNPPCSSLFPSRAGKPILGAPDMAMLLRPLSRLAAYPRWSCSRAPVPARRSPRKAPRLRRHRGRSVRDESVGRPCLYLRYSARAATAGYGLRPPRFSVSRIIGGDLRPAPRRGARPYPIRSAMRLRLAAADGALSDSSQRRRGTSREDCEIRQPKTAEEEANSRCKHGVFLLRRRISAITGLFGTGVWRVLCAKMKSLLIGRGASDSARVASERPRSGARCSQGS